ncbi:MAG: hypothetical protein HC893_05965, partial [Chloroflexaceae bacterium]|nr:hypothetical protein [Chloroflexaceae bacterium]
YHLPPAVGHAITPTHTDLAALLDVAHTRLCAPRVPRCHGIFLDTLSSAEQQQIADRTGTPLHGNPADLLVCPKPHISPSRVDLVSRMQHCCQDGRLCHIIHRSDSRKPLRPPRTAEELLNELQHLFSETPAAEPDEQAILTLAAHIEQMTRRFAAAVGTLERISIYYHRLRDLGMSRTFDRLDDDERESLALAVFLVEQLDSVQASDYSAPVIHIASVLERELQRRIVRCPGLTGGAFPHGRPTLGTLPFMLRHPDRTGDDWQRLLDYTAQHWQGAVDPDAPAEVVSFEAFIGVLTSIKHLRNRAAHMGSVPRERYSWLFRVVCQGGPLRIGALNVLLLAWEG